MSRVRSPDLLSQIQLFVYSCKHLHSVSHFGVALKFDSREKAPLGSFHHVVR